MSTCKHGRTAPDHILREIHESQAGIRGGALVWRHKCCVCAFARGEELARTQAQAPSGTCECKTTRLRAPEDVLRALPISQAGSSGLGRHQCVICALHEGFKAASARTSTSANAAYPGFGDESKKFQKRAREALPLLVAQAKARNTITYGQLALEMGMPNPRNLNMVLGALGTELKNLSQKWGKEIPPLNCIVINKHDRTPHQGIGFYMSPEEFHNLSASRQQEILLELNRNIWDYPRWDDVLSHFKLEPVVPAKSKSLLAIAKSVKEVKYGKGGGETEDHRRLKEYVKENPQLLGISRSLNGKIEHMFLSNDEIDVLFKCPLTWVGVEVKGVRSDSPDIMRGIFQCIKYKALMEATQRYEQVDVDSRVVLVLGGALPPDFRSVVGILNIEFVENVKVPANFQPSKTS